MPLRITTPMHDAAEKAVDAIARSVPDLRGKRVVIHMGTGGKQALKKYGHFASSRWTIKRGRRMEAVGEILIVAEALNRRPEDIFETILHECGHLVADVRGVKDCSRGGRYHNVKFKAIAEEIGLVPISMDGNGWAYTKLPSETKRRYARAIERIAVACKGYRQVDPSSLPRDPDRNPLPCLCACDPPRRIRVAKTTIDGPDIICTVCDSPFVPQGE